MPALQILRLSYNAITADSMNHALTGTDTLQEIRLDHNDLLWTDKQTMVADLSALKKLPHLRTLTLQSNPFEDRIGVSERQWLGWLLRLQPRLEVLNDQPTLVAKVINRSFLVSPPISLRAFGQLLDRAIQVPFTAEINLRQFRDGAAKLAECLRLGSWDNSGLMYRVFGVMEATPDEWLVATGFMQQVKVSAYELPKAVLATLLEGLAFFSACLSRGMWGGLGDDATGILLEFLQGQPSGGELSAGLRAGTLAAIRTVFCEALTREFEAERAHSLHRLFREQHHTGSTQLAHSAKKGSKVLLLKKDKLLDIEGLIVINHGADNEETVVVGNIDPLELKHALQYDHGIGESVVAKSTRNYFPDHAEERTVDVNRGEFIRSCYRSRHGPHRQLSQRNVAARLIQFALASDEVKQLMGEIIPQVCSHASFELRSTVCPDLEGAGLSQEVAQSHLLRRLSSQAPVPHMHDPLPGTFVRKDVRTIRCIPGASEVMTGTALIGIKNYSRS